MRLVFTQVTTLNPDGTQIQVGNEPDGELVQYFLASDRVRNSAYKIVLGNYSAVAFTSLPNRVPSRNYVRFGIKTFPKIGAYGWFRSKYENITHMLVPLRNQPTRYDPPSFSFTQATNTFTVTIVPPSTLSYMCYRIILRHEYYSYEVVTYDLVTVVDKPISNTYEIYVIGYRDTGEISEETPRQNITIISNNVPPGETFIGLVDTPNTYAGQAGKVPAVNSLENSLAFKDIYVSRLATLLASGWSGNSQSVTVNGVTASNAVIVAPDPGDQAIYASTGIKCTSQAADTLTFTCDTTPTADIAFGVIIL